VIGPGRNGLAAEVNREIIILWFRQLPPSLNVEDIIAIIDGE
jgi:hypothetical protein